MSDSVPPRGRRDGEVGCTVPLATAGSRGPAKPGRTWLRAELAVRG